MDITPIYELRTRLRAAAIAGTNLLSEDFRLKRAVEAIQPLEAASPVFAKIGALARELLSPEQADREGTLLDAITLVDALLCTQGEVTVTGEVQPLMIENRGNAVSNAPYSEVKALLDALLNSGGGRYSYLTEMHEKKPELFEDYRVKPALVQALGASYAELAEDVAGWLKEMGEPMLPLLEKDFDPKGKKEMLRRVEVIDAIAGAKANEFYLSQLPDAEKEIRQALIYALRHSRENEELLLSLIKTEKGKTKKVAYCALACQEGEEAVKCLEKLVEKKPEEGLAALSVSGTDWAADIVQKGLYELVEKFEGRIKSGEKLMDQVKDVTEELNALINYLNALKGKNSRIVSACCRRVAGLAEAPQMLHLKLLNNPEGGYKKDKNTTLKVLLARQIRDYLMEGPDEELTALALEMYETYKATQSGEEFFPAAVRAKMIREEDCSDWLWSELKRDKDSVLFDKLMGTFYGLCWNEPRKKWGFKTNIYDAVMETRQSFVCDVRQQVKGDFAQFLMGVRDGKTYDWSGKLDSVLEACIPNGDKEYEDMVMDHFYRQALKGGRSSNYYCIRLKLHDFPKCQGLAVHYFSGQGSRTSWEITNFLNNMPGSPESKREEGRELIKRLKGDSFGAWLTNDDLERLEVFVETLT